MNNKEAIKALVNDCKLGIWSDDSIDAIQCFVKLEKELKQTKLNFRNSQIHSKNSYKKLKEKYNKLEIANNNNEGLVRDNVKLMNRNLELEKENQELKITINSLELDTCIPELRKENQKLKQEIKIIKEKYVVVAMIKSCSLERYNNHVYEKFQLTQEEYELLKEVFEND